MARTTNRNANVLIKHYYDTTKQITIYPITKAKNVQIDPSINTKLPSTATTVEDIMRQLGSMAFKSNAGDNVLYIEEITTT